jgi:hypothetical protein
LPENVLIDYFEPFFWNHQMTVEDKAHYIKNGKFIGMPPAILCQEWEQVIKWKGLSREEMLTKFGEEVLKDYIFPTAEELKQLEENRKKKNEDSDEDGEDDEQAVQDQLGETGQ